MIYYFIPEKALYHIPATRFSVIFVWLDVFSFLVQATGGIILSGTNESAHLVQIGQWIYISGVALQQCFIVVFLGLLINFHLSILELEAQGTLWQTGKTHWRKLLYTLYASLALISVGLPLDYVNASRWYLFHRRGLFIVSSNLQEGLVLVILFPFTKFTCTASMPCQCRLHYLSCVSRIPGTHLLDRTQNFQRSREKRRKQPKQPRRRRNWHWRPLKRQKNWS